MQVTFLIFLIFSLRFPKNTHFTWVHLFYVLVQSIIISFSLADSIFHLDVIVKIIEKTFAKLEIILSQSYIIIFVPFSQNFSTCPVQFYNVRRAIFVGSTLFHAGL